jgi:hypothetical protein
MIKPLHPAKFLVVCLLLSVAEHPLFGQNSSQSSSQKAGQNSSQNAYDLFTKAFDEETPAELEVETAVHSELGGRFLKAYMAGDTKLAQTLWFSILKRLAKCNSLEHIDSHFRNMFTLDIPEDEVAKAKYSSESLNKFMIATTEKALTKKHRFYVDCLSNLARTYEGTRRWEDAALVRMNQYKLSQPLFGSEAERTILPLAFSGIDKCKMKHYSEAEPMLKTAFELAAKHKYRAILNDAGRAYYKLLLATNRPDKAKQVLALYGEIYPQTKKE